MARMSKKLLTVFIILFAAAAIFGLKYLRSGPSVPPIDPVAARTTGDLSAELHIIEYMDFECPACATGVRTLKTYIEKYPGKIYLQMHYFPLAMHKHGFRSAMFAHCAAKQGKFWEFQDLLIERQDSWKRMINADPAFQQMAVEAGLNTDQLDACLVDKSVEEDINQDKAQGEALGVQSTPTYFVNKEMVVGFKSLQQKLSAHFLESSDPPMSPSLPPFSPPASSPAPQ